MRKLVVACTVAAFALLGVNASVGSAQQPESVVNPTPVVQGETFTVSFAGLQPGLTASATFPCGPNQPGGTQDLGAVVGADGMALITLVADQVPGEYTGCRYGGPSLETREWLDFFTVEILAPPPTTAPPTTAPPPTTIAPEFTALPATGPGTTASTAAIATVLLLAGVASIAVARARRDEGAAH